MPTAQKLEAKPKIEEIKRPAMEEGRKTLAKLAQFVVFNLGGEEYGLEILDVREIVKTGQITMVPNMPDFIRGIINLRGKIVVVIDLEKRFLLQREGEYTGKHIIISLAKENMFGLLVDEVTEVLRLPEEAVKSAPELITEKIDSKYLTGVGTVEDRLIILLDVAKVLSEEELVKLSKVVGKHHRKIKAEEEEEEKKVEEVKPEEKKEEPKVKAEKEKPEVKEAVKKPKKEII